MSAKKYQDEYHRKQRESAKEREAGIAKRIEEIAKRAESFVDLHQTKAYDIRRRVKAQKVG